MLSLLFIIVLEKLSRQTSLRCPQESLLAADLALISETLEGLKGRLKAWKGEIVPNGLRINVKETKLMLSG